MLSVRLCPRRCFFWLFGAVLVTAALGVARAGRAAPRGPGLELRAVGSRDDDGRRALAFWALIEGPLLPRPRPRPVDPVPRGIPLAESEATLPPAGTPFVEPPTPTAPQPPSPPAAPAVALPAVSPSLSPALVKDAVAAAQRAAGSRRGRERLLAATRRSRRAAALPQIQARGGRTTDETLRLSPTVDDPYRFTESGQTRLVGEVRLRWELDRLLFDPAELRLLALEQTRAKAEAELGRRVLALLFAWYRARLRAADPTLDADARVEAALDAMEAELTLDVLTGGWFAVRVGTPGAAAPRARAAP